MSIVEYFKNKKNSKTKEAKKIVVKNPFEKFANTGVIGRLKELGKDLKTPKARSFVNPIPSDMPIDPFFSRVQGGQLSLWDSNLRPITFDDTEIKL